jgi:nucleoside-diphosphate-sugar epimerase
MTNLAKLILKLTHKEHLKIEYTDSKPGDILHSYADISKANRLLKFEPIYNQEKGLDDYLKWYDQKYGTNLLLN